MIKIINFSVLEIGFHGDTFLAWQHITNGIFHFILNVFYTTNVILQAGIVVNVVQIKLISQKSA